MSAKSKLALLGGEKIVKTDIGNTFSWPIITKEDEDAVLEVLRAGKMSGTDVTIQFEKEFKAWQGTKFALACNNGTAALHSAMWACGVTKGTEIIAPSMTYWATLLPALNLGAAVNFADIDAKTFNIDVNDIEHRINENTRAIVVVHYAGLPADMDPIMAIAKKFNLKVIEDVSHAQGSMYKGRKCGTIGDVGAMSLMAGKSLAIGEGGILVTDNQLIFERAAAFGHYERTGQSRYSDAEKIITDRWLVQYAGLPLGGFKYRMHQLSSACGRVQLKYYDTRCTDIQDAMNYFFDLLKDVPAVIARRTEKGSGSTMGGWYAACAGYNPAAVGGLSVEKFCEAVKADGATNGIAAGVNAILHTHELFHTADIYGDGKPTMLANTNRDIRQGKGTLKNAEKIHTVAMFVPWFRRNNKKVIEEHAAAYRKVQENYKDLL